MSKRIRDLLREADGDGVWVFTPSTFAMLRGEPEGPYHRLLLKRLVEQGVLQRVVPGIFVNPSARSMPSDPRLHLVPYLRPGEISYVSLESRLSEAGAISQITHALTLMTTGRAHSFETPWGIVDFTHTDRKEPLADGIEFREDSPVPYASLARAYKDLKRVGRNVDLVDVDELTDMIEEEEADERQDFGP